MEIRKLKVSPGDELRLRELLKIHETEVDALSDEELDEAERQNSEQLFRLLRKPKENVLPFRIPVKSGVTAALFAAAAALLFVQVQNQQAPAPSQLVSKGVEGNKVSCEIRLTGNGSKFVDGDHSYHVNADLKDTGLKLDCDGVGKEFYVHLGTKEGGQLHLVTSNLMGGESSDVLKELEGNSQLVVVVTQAELPKDTKEINAADERVLWSDTIPFILD